MRQLHGNGKGRNAFVCAASVVDCDKGFAAKMLHGHYLDGLHAVLGRNGRQVLASRKAKLGRCLRLLQHRIHRWQVRKLIPEGSRDLPVAHKQLQLLCTDASRKLTLTTARTPGASAAASAYSPAGKQLLGPPQQSAAASIRPLRLKAVCCSHNMPCCSHNMPRMAFPMTWWLVRCKAFGRQLFA